MPSIFINAAPVTLKLQHVSAMRSDTVTVQPGGLYCQPDRSVIAFVLGLSGHREACDPDDVWQSPAITQTPAGGRLVYLLADIRRPGDRSDQLAGLFCQGLTGLGAAALHLRRTGKEPSMSFAERWVAHERTTKRAESHR